MAVALFLDVRKGEHEDDGGKDTRKLLNEAIRFLWFEERKRRKSHPKYPYIDEGGGGGGRYEEPKKVDDCKHQLQIQLRKLGNREFAREEKGMPGRQDAGFLTLDLRSTLKNDGKRECSQVLVRLRREEEDEER